jgi:hypothetical protein
MSVLGTLVSDFKKGAEDVKSFLEKVANGAPAVAAKIITDVNAISPVVEAFVPGSTAAFVLGNTLIDQVAQAVEDAGAAAEANGINVAFDKNVVADMQAIIASAKLAASKV